jgi:hypothetical protein
VGGERGHGDDPAAARLLQVRDRRPHGPERRAEIDVHHRGVVIVGHRLDALAADQMPGVADQDVQPAEELGRSRDQRVDLGGVGDIGLQDGRPAAELGDQLAGLLGLVGRVAVMHDDLGPGLRQAEGDGGTDPVTGSGDQGAAPGQRGGIHRHCLLFIIGCLWW